MSKIHDCFDYDIISDCSPFNQSRKKTISTRSCLKDDGASGSSDTSIESNATLKIDKLQQNIHDLSSSDEQDGSVETHTEANMKKAETMSNV